MKTYLTIIGSKYSKAYGKKLVYPECSTLHHITKIQIETCFSRIKNTLSNWILQSKDKCNISNKKEYKITSRMPLLRKMLGLAFACFSSRGRIHVSFHQSLSFLKFLYTWWNANYNRPWSFTPCFHDDWVHKVWTSQNIYYYLNQLQKS